MSEYERTMRHAGTAAPADVDAGMRAHFNRVYMYMAGSLLVSALVAFATANTPALLNAIYGTGLKWVVAFAPLAFMFFISFRFQKMSLAGLQASFWAFAVLMGVSLSYVFVLYGMGSIAKAFLITAITFMATSLYGYTTNRNLSGFGQFLFMGLIGIILASIVNIFLGSPALSFAIDVIGVLIFAGLTAYDTQRIKEEFLYFANAGADGAAMLSKLAVMSALGLYLNFVNMFQMILSLTGGDE